MAVKGGELAITRFPFTASDTFNVTNLTEPGGAFSLLNGDSGSGWWVQGANGFRRMKKYAAHILQPTWFDEGSGSAESQGGVGHNYTTVYDERDEFEVNDDYSSLPLHVETDQVGWNVPNDNSGLRWVIPCDRRYRRELNFLCVTQGGPAGGGFSVTASLSDASHADAVYNFSIAGGYTTVNNGFKTAFRSSKAATCTVTLRRTSGGVAYITGMAVWLAVPVLAPASEAFKARSMGGF